MNDDNTPRIGHHVVRVFAAGRGHGAKLIHYRPVVVRDADFSAEVARFAPRVGEKPQRRRRWLKLK